ncbi:hypothetical protein LP417_21980 [Polaromonas sp. P1-6]|nr:hypothetical protein LP417_21980 [Polaromonas sp. P1-6]
MTPMTRSIYEGMNITRQREAIVVALKRIGVHSDIARTVDFLIHPGNCYITGMVDGRLTLSVLARIPGIARRKQET